MGCGFVGGALVVSHMLFADDSFFFFRADIDESRTMLRVFDTYAETSGKSINYGKSGIFFSRILIICCKKLYLPFWVLITL